MKKSILRTAVLLSCLASFSEAVAQFGVAIGPKAGVSITTFRGSDIDDIDARTNWLGGLFLNAQFGQIFTLQPEILLTRRGAEFMSNNIRRNIRINYFEVPVLAKFRVPLGDVVFPHVLLGPNFSFRTNVNYSSFDTGSGTAVTTNDSDIKDTDVGALIGLGIDLQTRGSGLFFTIDGRYGFGFNNINRVDDTIKIRNAGWTFAAGVGLLLTRDVDE